MKETNTILGNLNKEFKLLADNHITLVQFINNTKKEHPTEDKDSVINRAIDTYLAIVGIFSSDDMQTLKENERLATDFIGWDINLSEEEYNFINTNGYSNLELL